MSKTVRRTFPVEGMGCAACVLRVENSLKDCEGVEEVSVSLASNSARVDYDPSRVTPEKLRDSVRAAGYDLHVEEGETVEEQVDKDREKAYQSLVADTIIAVVLAVGVMFLSMWVKPFNGKGTLLALMAGLSVFYCGRRFHLTAIRQATHLSTGMDTLVSLSTIISFLFSVFNLVFPEVWTSRGLPSRLYFESSAMIIAFILLGRSLEERAKRSTTASVRSLSSLQPRDEKIGVGESVLVKPGARIPADGVVLFGSSYVDESLLTGEPLPALKEKGSKVYAGTINQKGSFSFEATKVGGDTMISSIVEMVKEAQGSKAKIQGIVDKVASVFVPVIIAISVLSLLGWCIFSGEDGLTKGLLSMVTVLVVACPCSLGLATPTALIVGIGRGASSGILIKNADALQVSGKIDSVLLDKTGTITRGRPEVVRHRWFHEGLEGVLKGMEKASGHPLGDAMVSFLDGVDPIQPASVKSVPGKGVEAMLEGIRYSVVGTSGEMADGEALSWMEEGFTVVTFLREDIPIGNFAIADEVKSTSREAVSRLSSMGIDVHMLTGDNPSSAEAVARKVGISSVHSRMFPADKAEYVRALQRSSHKVAMCGDGINDSAALALSDLSIAMGHGSDMAMDTAMVTIVSGDIAKIPQMVSLSRKTVRIIKENLLWAGLYNIVAVPVASGILYPLSGFVLNPMIAAAAMAFSSVLVVCNSLRLKRAKL